ncbi:MULTISPECIES: hypothetical protein [unclassified Burkholderia]|uniref:hypothetical protein n=1 Tax=unclassified Burkholderia TaxID=2613784 RepID=UPI00162A8829|nr:MULTISPECIES: hypothetical protein [unclassified Burkholderia]
MRANALARPEHPQSQLQQFIRDTLRAAATAPTVFDALDLCADALLTLAELSRSEVRHA